jgi:hypothetical protein
MDLYRLNKIEKAMLILFLRKLNQIIFLFNKTKINMLIKIVSLIIIKINYKMVINLFL